MINGIEMVFSKDKMVERLKHENRIDKIPKEILDIMDDLDGQSVGANSWNRMLFGEPVYTCTGKSGMHRDVNEKDCIPKYESH